MDLTKHEFVFLRYLMEDEGDMIEDIIEAVEDAEGDGNFFDDGTSNDELYNIRNSAYNKLLSEGVRLGHITEEDRLSSIG